MTLGSSTVFHHPSLDLFHSIAGWRFHEQSRPTIAQAVVHANRVLFVQTERGGTFMLPQGALVDENGRVQGGHLYDAALRWGMVKVGLESQYLTLNRAVLGEYLNPIPSDRKQAYAFKQVFCVALKVWSNRWVRLGEEYKQYVWVGSREHLMSLLGSCETDRPVKFLATCAVIDALRGMKMLSWGINQQPQGVN